MVLNIREALRSQDCSVHGVTPASSEGEQCCKCNVYTFIAQLKDKLFYMKVALNIKMPSNNLEHLSGTTMAMESNHFTQHSIL